SVAFLVVNVLGFATYFIFPVAPPWYVTEYGLGPARLDVHPAAAAASRFDLLLGTHFFDGIYGRGIDVYGAYPSLHVAYPLLVVWAACASGSAASASPGPIGQPGARSSTMASRRCGPAWSIAGSVRMARRRKSTMRGNASCPVALRSRACKPNAAASQ